jgi:hypothetical protein
MGDGWLAEFPTVAGAVNCAIEVRQQLASHDIIKLRMGIDIRDVAVDEEDAYGICVNVAARLETFTTSGTVAISDAVYSSLDGTLKPGFEDAGFQQLKISIVLFRSGCLRRIDRSMKWAAMDSNPMERRRWPGYNPSYLLRLFRALTAATKYGNWPMP